MRSSQSLIKKIGSSFDLHNFFRQCYIEKLNQVPFFKFFYFSNIYIYIYIYIYILLFYSSSIPNRFGYFTALLSRVLAMEFTVSSVLVPKSSANVFCLHISLLALAGVDCVSLRSLKTFFGLCCRWGSGRESMCLAGVTNGFGSLRFCLVPEWSVLLVC